MRAKTSSPQCNFTSEMTGLVSGLLWPIVIGWLCCVAAATASPAQTLTTLASFDQIDGSDSEAPLTQGPDGNFYGTTFYGGTGGNVFKVTPSGTLTSLYSFCSKPNCADGSNPAAGLALGTDGNFYGTTSYGSVDNDGTVFEVTPAGALTTLQNLPNGSYNWGTPAVTQAGLLLASDGNFYGTTPGGGTTGGTVFRMTQSGTLTTLYNFCSQPNCADGATPSALLLQATDGAFYGTTYYGGSGCNITGGCGTVFKITPSGTLTTLYSFCLHTGCPDGWHPKASLVQGFDGNLYGTTSAGGPYTDGTIFKMTTAGALTTLHSLYYNTDGSVPSALVQATDGNFYGTAYYGGTDQSGTIFEITPTGTFTTLHNFDGTDGASPDAALIQAIDGNFYGTTFAGGSDEQGTVFRLTGPTPTAVQFVPVTPCRLADTRQTQTPIQAGTFQFFNVPQLGGCNIPATAAAYSLNVTVVPHQTLGYLTIWQAGRPQPNVSTMNSPDGRVKANAAIVPAGANAAVSVYASDTTDVILDIDGYFAAPASGTYQFYPLTPCRVMDTRNSSMPQGLGPPALQAQLMRVLPILTSPCFQGVSQPQAYSFNFTVVPNPQGQPLAYLTVWPEGDSQPEVSTLNNPTATVVANAAIVQAGEGGELDVFAENSTDLIIDVNGYFAVPGTGGLSMDPAAPCRVLDTRQSGGQFSGELTVNVVGSACAPPSNAGAYIFNATVVPPGSMPYLTLWPDGQQQPTVSTLNAYDGFITSNMAIVPTNNGSIDAYAAGRTQLILDISGYFAP